MVYFVVLNADRTGKSVRESDDDLRRSRVHRRGADVKTVIAKVATFYSTESREIATVDIRVFGHETLDRSTFLPQQTPKFSYPSPASLLAPSGREQTPPPEAPPPFLHIVHQPTFSPTAASDYLEATPGLAYVGEASPPVRHRRPLIRLRRAGCPPKPRNLVTQPSGLGAQGPLRFKTNRPRRFPSTPRAPPRVVASPDPAARVAHRRHPDSLRPFWQRERKTWTRHCLVRRAGLAGRPAPRRRLVSGPSRWKFSAVRARRLPSLPQCRPLWNSPVNSSGVASSRPQTPPPPLGLRSRPDLVAGDPWSRAPDAATPTKGNSPSPRPLYVAMNPSSSRSPPAAALALQPSNRRLDWGLISRPAAPAPPRRHPPPTSYLDDRSSRRTPPVISPAPSLRPHSPYNFYFAFRTCVCTFPFTFSRDPIHFPEPKEVEKRDLGCANYDAFILCEV
ncbi:extensin-like [Ananas comosus]|uniref:Extensin-like n=1 Tax=Ananas comosus TaxID=4615 RepID=A0A6P5FAT4_ANACO|nr:extensin-like [Ananas comosus]